MWSYNENAPAQELSAEKLESRKLGYWSLAFDDEGGVIRGTYHGSNGAPWLSFWYADVDGRVYADLHRGGEKDPSTRLSRKSTKLANRMPSWPSSEE